MSSENHAFDELRSILLSKDKEEFYQINDNLRTELISEIDSLKNQLDDPDLFADKISGARTQIIDILGPVMGRMIKKYLQVEIEKLNQKLQSGTNKLTSAAYWKSVFTGKHYTGKVFDKPEILEILIISTDSGLLTAKYSLEKITDADIVAGMFTAIKSFMETVLDSKESEVGLIDYGEFKILVQNFGSFYFAFIFKGSNDPAFKQELIEHATQFVEKYQLHLNKDIVNDVASKTMSHDLEKHFKELCKK